MFVISQKANRVMKKILFYGLYVLSLWPICDKIFGMKMEYKTFAIIGIMWAFCAHCSVGDSKLTHQKFPKTVNDLSFIEMMQLKAEGYKPWFDKKAYVPIVLKDGGGKQQAAEPIDYCKESIEYNMPQLAGGGKLEHVALSPVFGQGNVACDENKDVNGRSCARYCALSDELKGFEGDVCVYSNVDELKLDELLGTGGNSHGAAFQRKFEGDYVVNVFFASVERDSKVQINSDGTGVDTQMFKRGVKIGKITDKNNFYYCIELWKGNEAYCADGQRMWKDGCEGNNSATDAGDSSGTDAPAGEGS